ncbi:MAG TPA: DUF3168 domain-containing protein [Vicinamibacterales bacterium]|nr:DUF3168 domain-containing protein [Vicinamibacterales bacterium]
MTTSMEDLLQTVALGPVSAGIYAALNVPRLTSLATGGIWTDVPQGATYPAVLFDVTETQQLGGFGTKPGVGMLPEIALRIHVYSQYAGFDEAHRILSVVKSLLADAPDVDGWSSWAIFWDDVIPLADEVVAGVKVKELVANARLFVEAQS